MRAIVKVSKKSSFSGYNGYSFPVDSMGWKIITLVIGGHLVDFGFREVLIQDLGDVLYDAKQKKDQDPDTYSKINAYLVANDFLPF